MTQPQQAKDLLRRAAERQASQRAAVQAESERIAEERRAASEEANRAAESPR
jgi:hypothetical protein